MESAWFEPAEQRSARRHAATVLHSRASLALACEHAAHRAAAALLALRKPEGYWCGDLRADTTLESDYILLQLWLHPPVDGLWQPPTLPRLLKAQRSILDRQLPDGGFNIYPKGPSEISATVKAYVALKLTGLSPDSEPLERARRVILSLGGLQAANSYVKINLSLFGLYPRKHVPTVPPELVLLPGNVLYEMSSWTRAIVVPLSIVQARGGIRPVPAGFNIDEILAPDAAFRLPRRGRAAVLFHHLDKVFKLWENRGSEDIRRAAIRDAEKWMLDRTRYSEGLGAIYPSMMYLIMALDSLGYPSDHPDLNEALRQFENLLTETPTDFYFQPCFSPVWDTAIAMFALGEMGAVLPELEPALTRAADWLIAREVRHRGDWSVKRPDVEPSGWAFEFANEHYPDIDDTAMVLLALEHARASNPSAQANCERRALNWLLEMQSADGGWAAFDVDNNWAILNKVPFADHNAMLDPTCADITGRVLEALCRRGLDPAHSAVRRGVAYLLQTQERNGSWYGRWGVNFIYGTFLALRGLRAAAPAEAADSIRRAARWVASVQNPDGGWGESCAGYNRNRFVPAPSTPSQTAWALLALLAANSSYHDALARGIHFLSSTQKPDGTWDEDLATGTGFPRVFYLTYTLYRNYFPLLALTSARRALEIRPS